MTTSAPNDPALPTRIGAFRLIEVLGEGAMGRVYLAEQDQPRRQVALKLLRSLASGEAMARFRREVEALAELEHPGIARVYAAGTAELASGAQPWLAMEVVRGLDLRRHVTEQGLDLAARVALLAQVCHAVHHAHTRGVIHRDLKPANVLVDDSGRVRVLDFGIARLAGADEQTRMTAEGQVLGTLPYMSEEQLTGEASLDLRADVYALGVIAYELLAGELPYPRLPQATLLGAIEQRRRHPPRALGEVHPPARGDLNTIVMKAMAAERSQRYASALDLARDLERFLARQPIEARPPTASYVLSCFVRRHRGLATSALLALVAILGAGLVALRFGLAEAEAKRQALARLEERESVYRFVTELLTAANPERAQGEALTVREILDGAVSSLEDNAGLAPRTRAVLSRLLGRSYSALGVDAQALPLLEAARDLIPAGSAERDEIDLDIAQFLLKTSQPEAALARLAPLSARLEQLDPVLRAGVAQVEGEARSDLGEVAAGAERLAQGLERARRELGPRHPETLQLLYAAAIGEFQRSELQRSRELTEELLAAYETSLGPRHPRTLFARDHLGIVFTQLGDHARAEALLRQALADSEQVFGRQHPSTLTTELNLVNLLSGMGQTAEALPRARQVYEGFRSRRGPENFKTLSAQTALAYALEDQGLLDEAEAHLRDLVTAAERRGPASPDALPARNNLAMLLVKRGDLRAARGEFATVHQRARELLGADHLFTAVFASNYGDCLTRLGEPASALPLLEEARRTLEARLGADHARSRTVRERLAATLRALGREAEAAALAPA
ncbi:MAG TPA: serine/threonine-protein kinase [Nevskiaceae bacterium]|nr:serine/threonine-protein kinase [Nevskiaceae bacterium]